MLTETRLQDERLAALEAVVEARTHDLQSALDQRTALLHELDHRVKNNLQLISSLMMMQARRTADPSVKAVLDSMLERLNAVATVHRRLFQSEDVERFDLSEFVRDLVSDLSNASGRTDLNFQCQICAVQAPAARAASLALLINELLTNAVRHAFPGGRSGRISVSIVKSPSELMIEIADDGVGMGGPAAGEVQGFGLTIVELLARQLKARVTRTEAHPGVRTEVVLPLDTMRGAS